jgi:hypothetical protein
MKFSIAFHYEVESTRPDSDNICATSDQSFLWWVRQKLRFGVRCGVEGGHSWKLVVTREKRAMWRQGTGHQLWSDSRLGITVRGHPGQVQWDRDWQTEQ